MSQRFEQNASLFEKDVIEHKKISWRVIIAGLITLAVCAVGTPLMPRLLSELHPSTHVDRGMIFKDKGKYDDAIKEFNIALMLDPSWGIADIGLGMTYAQLEDFEGAITHYSKALQLQPSFTEVYLLRAVAYYRVNNDVNALSDLNYYLSLNRNSAEGYLIRGTVLLRTGDRDGAIADFKRVLTMPLGDDPYWYLEAQSALQQLSASEP